MRRLRRDAGISAAYPTLRSTCYNLLLTSNKEHATHRSLNENFALTQGAATDGERALVSASWLDTKVSRTTASRCPTATNSRSNGVRRYTASSRLPSYYPRLALDYSRCLSGRTPRPTQQFYTYLGQASQEQLRQQQSQYSASWRIKCEPPA